jgi:hypothetical protein
VVILQELLHLHLPQFVPLDLTGDGLWERLDEGDLAGILIGGPWSF